MKIYVLIQDNWDENAVVLAAFADADLANQHLDTIERMQAAKPSSKKPGLIYTEQQWRDVWNMQYPNMDSDGFFSLHAIDVIGTVEA